MRKAILDLLIAEVLEKYDSPWEDFEFWDGFLACLQELKEPKIFKDLIERWQREEFRHSKK